MSAHNKPIISYFLEFAIVFLKYFSLFSRILRIFSFGKLQTMIDFGRGQCFGAEYADEGDHTLQRCADEQKDLRGGKRITENADDGFSHDFREDRAEHHAEKCGEVGNDGMERKIIRSVFVGQIDIRQGRHDGSRCDAEYVLRKAYGNIKPNGICRNERIGVIGCRMEDQNDGERAEPIMLGDQLLPHVGEEDKEQKIRGVDAVAERIADADVIQNIGVKRGVRNVERERISGGDHDRAEKAFIFEGEREDIGKFRARFRGVRKFLWNQPNRAIHDGKRESDESDGDEHGSFLRSIFQAVSDCGNGKCDGEGDGAVDAACGIEIIHADVVGQEIRIPCGKAGGEKLIDGVCHDDQNDKSEQKRFRILDQHWEQGDADDIDGIERQFARNKNPFSFFETFENGGREDIEQTCDIRNEGKNTDLRFIQSVHQEKARVEKTSRKLPHEPCHDGGKEHTGAPSAEIVFHVIHVEERTCFYPFFKLTEKTLHKESLSAFWRKCISQTKETMLLLPLLYLMNEKKSTVYSRIFIKFNVNYPNFNLRRLLF